MPKGMIGGDHLFEGKTEFAGMIAGDATVATGADLKLGGMIAGDLIIMPDAKVELSGMVAGRIVNRGGSLTTG